MSLIAIIAAFFASLGVGSDGLSGFPGSDPTVGDRYEIIVSYETSQRSSDGSSGSSSGRNTHEERVIAVSDLGVELEFDLPEASTDEERDRVWQYPARVLQPSDGPMRLLNRPDLEVRLDRWLEAAGLPKAACGQWIFTWTAFRIECDPESVLSDIEAFDLRSADIREGAPYRHSGALGTGTLTRTSERADRITYSVRLEVDADAVRKARAESDVVVGEITQAPVTLESALMERSKETISGTVDVTFEVDAAGRPIRRTVITTIDTVHRDGVSETETRQVRVERRAIAGSVSSSKQEPQPDVVASAEAACIVATARVTAERDLPTSHVAQCDPLADAEGPDGYYVLGLRAHCREELCGSTLIGWFAVEKATGAVFEWDMAEGQIGVEVRGE